MTDAIDWTPFASREEMVDYCRQAEAHQRAQAAEIERLRADAARYRWLRDGGRIALNTKGNPVILWNEADADAAIDKAMGATNGV